MIRGGAAPSGGGGGEARFFLCVSVAINCSLIFHHCCVRLLTPLWVLQSQVTNVCAWMAGVCV